MNRVRFPAGATDAKLSQDRRQTFVRDVVGITMNIQCITAMWQV
jgi:hypothetical protein